MARECRLTYYYTTEKKRKWHSRGGWQVEGSGFLVEAAGLGSRIAGAKRGGKAG